MTKYYYGWTNASYEVVAVDEEENKCMYVGLCHGNDANTGIDLCPERDDWRESKIEEKIEELKKAYTELAEKKVLYSVQDMEYEDPERICEWANEEEGFEKLFFLCDCEGI